MSTGRVRASRESIWERNGNATSETGNLLYVQHKLQYCHWQRLTLLQKELDAIGKHSRTCKSERDSLREEKIAWVKTEAGLRDSVKKLEETCTEVEHKRMALQYELQDAKACHIICFYSALCFNRTGKLLLR